MGAREKEREFERLIPLSIGGLSINDGSKSTPPSPDAFTSASAAAAAAAGREAFSLVIRSWLWKKFMTGCVILLPICITFYITWSLIHFVDGFFSPIYSHLGINIFGLGFITSIPIVFLVGVFTSSWVGASLLSLGEWFIVKMPLMSYIYAASKQISSAISPDQSSHAFKEVAIIRHPHRGEYAFGFITSSVILRTSIGAEELCCVYVPTNHLYLGDLLLINSKDIIRPDLCVREAIGKNLNCLGCRDYFRPFKVICKWCRDCHLRRNVYAKVIDQYE